MSNGNTTIAIQSLLDRLKLNPEDPGIRKELVIRSYERLSRIAHRIVGPDYRERVEDTSGLLAESYSRLDKALSSVRPESVRQYFGLAALHLRRTLIDLIRDDRGRSGNRPRPVALESSDAPAGEDTKQDWRLELMDSITRLENDEREVVDLLFFNGLTQLEVAGVLEVDESTVKRRWARARVRLAKWLHAFGE